MLNLCSSSSRNSFSSTWSKECAPVRPRRPRYHLSHPYSRPVLGISGSGPLTRCSLDKSSETLDSTYGSPSIMLTISGSIKATLLMTLHKLQTPTKPSPLLKFVLSAVKVTYLRSLAQRRHDPATSPGQRLRITSETR